MQKCRIFIIVSILFGAPPDHATPVGKVVVGVNIWNEGVLSKTAQDAEIKQMADRGVKTIRTSLLHTTTDFITQAFQHGIGSVVIVYLFLGSVYHCVAVRSDGNTRKLPIEAATGATRPTPHAERISGLLLAAAA